MSNKYVAVGFAAALALTAVSAALAQDKKPDADSQKFIKAAVEGNIAEVDAGKLAQEKGKSQAVKDFGAMLVKDHGAAKLKSEAAAKAVNVDPPTGSSVAQKAEYAKFTVLSGDTFDKSFAKSMVKDHQADIEEYKKISSKADAVGAYAKETLPTLQHHLEMAQKLQQQVDAPTTGSGAVK